ncbi:MAG: class I SAM-dependent methyltransferase [Candidatus Jordarchaeales archaeon]
MKFRILDKLIEKIAKRLWYDGASGSWEAIFSLLEKHKGSTLLDFGCGDGSSTMLVAAHVNASKVIGVDLDDEALKKAREKGILTYKADLNEKLPLDDECVDIVFANQVIEHLINVDNFVSEIYRVLRRGGCVVICTENLASRHNIFALLLGNQPYSGPYVSTRYVIGHHPLHPRINGDKGGDPYLKHNTVLAYRALKRIFEVYGFKVEKIIGSGYPRILYKFDPAHAHFITLKARKLPRARA